MIFRSNRAMMLVMGLLFLNSAVWTATAADSPKTEKNKKADDKIALVNDIAIPRMDFESELKQVHKRASMQGQTLDETQTSELNKSVLTRLIDQELLFQETRKKNVKVESQKCTEALADLKKGFPSEDDFKKALSETSLTETQLLEKIEKGLVIRKLLDAEVGQKIKVAEPEAKTFYESHPDYFKMDEQAKASHILIKVPDQKDEAQKAKAKKEIEEIQAKLKKGESFAELAKKSSQCPSSAQGGDLGFFRKGQMVKPFEEVAFALQPGQTSSIVETEFGFHLIQLAEKKPAGAVPFEEAKVKITDFLKQQQMEQGIKQYIETLRAGAKIKEFL